METGRGRSVPTNDFAKGRNPARTTAPIPIAHRPPWKFPKLSSAWSSRCDLSAPGGSSPAAGAGRNSSAHTKRAQFHIALISKAVFVPFTASGCGDDKSGQFRVQNHLILRRRIVDQIPFQDLIEYPGQQPNRFRIKSSGKKLGRRPRQPYQAKGQRNQG